MSKKPSKTGTPGAVVLTPGPPQGYAPMGTPYKSQGDPFGRLGGAFGGLGEIGQQSLGQASQQFNHPGVVRTTAAAQLDAYERFKATHGCVTREMTSLSKDCLVEFKKYEPPKPGKIDYTRPLRAELQRWTDDWLRM